MVHILLKPSLKESEYYLTSTWNKYNCTVFQTFFGIVLLWDWNENWHFPLYISFFFFLGLEPPLLFLLAFPGKPEYFQSLAQDSSSPKFFLIFLHFFLVCTGSILPLSRASSFRLVIFLPTSFPPNCKTRMYFFLSHWHWAKGKHKWALNICANE